jgi:hypothetical protein
MTTSNLPHMDKEEKKRRNHLAKQLWLKWKESPEAQAAIPKELIVDVLCELAPSLATRIRIGTSKFQSKS